MNQKDKHAYFQKISARRIDCIIEALDALGNCSKPTSYAYEDAELPTLFRAITDKLEEVWQRLLLHSPSSSIPFRLKTPDTLKLCGHVVHSSELAEASEVLELLEDGAPCFTALEPIRERYQARFGDELCWCCPIPHDGHSGCVLLPVKEGILYFAYNEVDGETYEQFDLQNMGLLTQSRLEELRNGLRQNTVELFHLLSGIQAYGLVQEEEEHKDTAVQRALDAQNLYLLRWGRPTESDHSINDINRELIQAMADENDGQVYLGSFHGDTGLYPYDGGVVRNFQCDFCVPAADQELEELLLQCRSCGWSSAALNRVHARIEELGGHLLLWV